MHGLSCKNLNNSRKQEFLLKLSPLITSWSYISIYMHKFMSVRSPIMRRCIWIDLYQFGILNILLYRFLWIFLQFGGHLWNMQIRKWRRHFSACQHWFFDSAYQNTPNRHLKTFSSQNACTFLNKRLLLIFFLTNIHCERLHSTLRWRFEILNFCISGLWEISCANQSDKDISCLILG